MTRPCWALLILSGVQVSCAQQTASSLDDCGGQLALVGEVQLSADELTFFAGETAAAGQRLPQDRALRDLVWQEAERQRLGLPGGPDLRKSRHAAIRAYRQERVTGQREPLAMDVLPAGASLTPCGERVIQGAQTSR